MHHIVAHSAQHIQTHTNRGSGLEGWPAFQMNAFYSCICAVRKTMLLCFAKYYINVTAHNTHAARLTVRRTPELAHYKWMDEYCCCLLPLLVDFVFVRSGVAAFNVRGAQPEQLRIGGLENCMGNG